MLALIVHIPGEVSPNSWLPRRTRLRQLVKVFERLT